MSKAKPRTKRATRAGQPAKKSSAGTKVKAAAKVRAKAKPDAKDWRAETLARMRALILETDPEMIEEQKWKKPSNGMVGVPVWSHNGIVCTGETYKNVVKLTFAKGASLPDPTGLFNSSLEGNTRRAIDIHEGEKVNAAAFKTLIRAAVAHNGSPADRGKASAKVARPLEKVPKPSTSKAKPSTSKAKPIASKAKPVKLLSGGNPQIAKGDGDAPVQEYIAAMPGWKRDLGKRLDALIVRHAPKVQKAVKWNSPFYGIEGKGWFLSFHVFTRYVKVTFFTGTSLRPVPPGGTSKDARWFDIHENDKLDEAQLAAWIKQAAAIPGWMA